MITDKQTKTRQQYLAPPVTGGWQEISRHEISLCALFASFQCMLLTSSRNGPKFVFVRVYSIREWEFQPFRPFSFASENDILGHSGVANARVMNNFGTCVLQIFTTSPTLKGVRYAELSAVRNCRISSRIQRQILATATRYGLLQVSG